MVDGYSAQQMRDAEAPRLAAGEPLMARAVAGLAREIRAVLSDAVGTPTGRVLLLVGSGNNGGDALFAGAELAEGGCDVSVIEVGSRTHGAGRAAALAAGARVLDVAVGDGAAGGDGVTAPADGAHVNEAAIRDLAAGVDVIVDGILGTGAGAGSGSSPALRGKARAVVTAILPVVRSSGAPRVVAVDIPSGIGPDDGSVPDPIVLPADVTVTFGGYKAGLLLSPAREFAGDVRLIDIGLAADLARMEPLVRRR